MESFRQWKCQTVITWKWVLDDIFKRFHALVRYLIVYSNATRNLTAYIWHLFSPVYKYIASFAEHAAAFMQRRKNISALFGSQMGHEKSRWADLIELLELYIEPYWNLSIRFLDEYGRVLMNTQQHSSSEERVFSPFSVCGQAKQKADDRIT